MTAGIRYSRNITINYLFILFTNLDLTRGLWMIYLASRGFTLLQLGIFEGVFHLTSFAMEVPTGVVADLWGRKISRIVGRIFFLLSLVLLFYARSFWFQLIGFAVCAVGYNLESGAGDALVYDSLLLDGRKHEYMRINGRKEFLLHIAVIIAYLVGGYLAVRSYPVVFYISMIICVVSLTSGIFFIEPDIRKKKRKTVIENEGGKEAAENLHKPRGQGSETVSLQPASVPIEIWKSMYSQTVESLAVIRKRPRIAFLLVFSELIFTFLTCLFFYLQNYWKGEGRDEFYIGAVFAIGALVAGLFSLKTQEIEKRIGERGVLLLMPLLLVICLWGVALTSWQAVFYIITGVIEGILVIAIGDYINRLIPSENRATILSFQSMIFSFFMIILFPVVGWLGDAVSLKTAFFLMAVVVTLGYLVFLIFFRAGRNQEPVNSRSQ